MLLPESPEPRFLNGVTILGPDFFDVGEDGRPLSPIASAFPRHGIVVAGRGIHAMQAETALQYLRKGALQERGHELTADDEVNLYEDAVSLMVSNGRVLIRSDPEDMAHTFAADELLRRFLSKESIQFTGAHLTEVRDELRRRGECWRISPHPRSVEEIGSFIRASRIHVATDAIYFYSMLTGGRFLTYAEFMKIRPLIRTNRQEVLARVSEILHLADLVNDQGERELSFFLPAEKELDTALLKDLSAALQGGESPEAVEKQERLFDRFAGAFAGAAGAELQSNDEENLTWRTTMFCRLSDINEMEVEEWALGLSPEFYLNVRWLPGAQICCGELSFEQNTEPRVQSLIAYYFKEWEGLCSINVGRIESSQTERDRTGEQREVYLMVLELPDNAEEIRIVRMIKWDIMHRINRGVALNQAIAETLQYREYIYDRLKAAATLGIPVPAFRAIELTEHLKGLGWIPTIFFDRRYVPGVATDKIPARRYSDPEFVVRLAGLLGHAAGMTLAVGRASPLTGHVFFDDGDEVIQLDENGYPDRVILADTTGSFTDWISPMHTMVPHCLWHVAGHLDRARAKGVGREKLAEAVDNFTSSLGSEIGRLQEILREKSSSLAALFSERSLEPGGIRRRWEGVLDRLEHTSIGELLQVVADNEDLAPFRRGYG